MPNLCPEIFFPVNCGKFILTAQVVRFGFFLSIFCQCLEIQVPLVENFSNMHATILIKTGPLVAIEGGNKYFPARLDSTCLKTFLLCFYSNMYIQTQLTFFLHTQRKVFFLGYFLLSQHLATPTNPPCQQISAIGNPPTIHLFNDVIFEWSLVEIFAVHSSFFLPKVSDVLSFL